MLVLERLRRGLTATGLLVLLSSSLAGPATAQLHIPVPPLPGLEIRISNEAPPRIRRERTPVRPDREHVYIKGHWDWQGDQWVWVSGRWERPSSRSNRWIAARYVRDGRAWRYEPGHWSDQRVIEGDDYRRWKEENHRGRGRGRDRDHDRDRDRDGHRN